MATAEEIGKDTKDRILADLNYFDNNMPERYAIGWGGYIASLYEWSFITQECFAELVALLPEISEPNPIAEIFEGRNLDDD